MRDLDKALADIAAIRSQIGAEKAFQGYGSMAIAVTALLAAVTATAQSHWLTSAQPLLFIAGWASTALLAISIVGLEVYARSRRQHSGVEDALIYTATEQFVPALAIGALLTVVLARFAPDALWMLPGLWQLLVGLGLFAALGALPKAVIVPALWYVVAGCTTLSLASIGRSLSPWSMGGPFIVGQSLLAAALFFAKPRYADT